MPAGRPARQRLAAVTNENDENAGTTRLTRAKAAALSTTSDAHDLPKKALATKKSATNVTGAAHPRKRAALGDVSNVAKGAEVVDGKEKKPLAGKAGLVSKAAQPTGIQKPSRTNLTRTILAAKDRNTAHELKRPASGSGVVGNVSKKRNVSGSSTKSIKEEEATENLAPSSRTTKTVVTVEIEPNMPAKKEFTVKSTTPTALPEAAEEEEVPDLDKEDGDDPLMVAEYVVEIFDYLRELELTTMANPNYMESQGELEWKMRGILVDWLLEVHTRFRLLPETLFLAVNIIDRFLSMKVVQLDRLQLVGVTAMFIASKYEEVLSPHVQNFRHVADDGFTEEEILSAERFVLGALNYDLSYPNPMNFLRRISKADSYDIQTRTLGKYLLEISCLDHRFIAHEPSRIAAASMYLARLVLERGDWDATLAHYAGYTEEEIQPVLLLMIDYLRSPVVHEAFFKKYASKKFLKASIVLRAWAKKWAPYYLGEDATTKSAKQT
ncbi:G2/mitotic-specific cyclin [Coniosporium apollinis]|uniref:G2/mitotic-specific cyclin n=2 Tax=Coniosporium TaxID=2810619 RepID=A0ABQ9NR97_9PEZI|nr:G2/mitotic-specific cyclin [Cladosporium sp. JES 115]KAJ9663759.1 G2/mitotic-specific cyclin [Coniosporium apollinis]